jgi:Uma2 family endonuclease
MSVQIERRYFNVDEYYRMGEAGIFTEDDRVELIEGEIIKISPIGSRHAACVNRILNKYLGRYAGQGVIVQIQNPVRLSDFSEPEPDVAVLRARDDFYAAAHPTPADVLLLIEVADTSVDYDRNIKLPMYARAGVPEVWLIDLSSEVVELYAQPAGGQYGLSRQAGRGESLTSQNIPDLTLDVNVILG